MSDYSQFFLASPRSVAELELIEISHPSFSKTYRIVRNKFDGVTVYHEGAGSPTSYDYYPCNITRSGVLADLDSSLNIDLGDLGDIVSAEIDATRAAGTMTTKPTVKFRTYRSDTLSAPLNGPLVYEIKNVALTPQGTSFTAQAQSLNAVVTGEYYTITNFPMLRAFL